MLIRQADYYAFYINPAPYIIIRVHGGIRIRITGIIKLHWLLIKYATLFLTCIHLIRALSLS